MAKVLRPLSTTLRFPSKLYRKQRPRSAGFGRAIALADFAKRFIVNHTPKTFSRRSTTTMLASSILRWMPQLPFRYYMFGFRDFVLSGDFEEFSRPDAASCFVRLVLNKLETKPQDIAGGKICSQIDPYGFIIPDGAVKGAVVGMATGIGAGLVVAG